MIAERVDESVAAQAPWMEDLLVALVETPTELGHEDAGQALISRAYGECGLEPRDLWLDPDALRAHPHASPFSWDRQASATWWRAGRPPGRVGVR